MGFLTLCPRDDLAPLMAWMEDRKREKARRSATRRGCCYKGGPIWRRAWMPIFCKKTLASLANPPVAARTRGVKVACSISRILCS